MDTAYDVPAVTLPKLILGAVGVLAGIVGVTCEALYNRDMIDPALRWKVTWACVFVAVALFAVAAVIQFREQGGLWAPGERPERPGFPVQPPKDSHHDR